MRDIVLRPNTKPLIIDQPESIIEPQGVSVPSQNTLKKAGSFLSLLVPKRKFTVMSQPRTAPTVNTSVVRKSPRLPIVIAHFQPRQQRLVHQLNTPLGRVTLLQGAALVALFAFVLSTNHRGGAQSSSSLAATLAPPTLRQFLPTSTEAETTLNTPIALADITSTGDLSIWATPWNIDSIAKAQTHFKYVSAFWLDLAPDGHSVTPKADWTAWDQYRKSTQALGTEYYLTISGDPTVTQKMLTNTGVRDEHINALLSQVQSHNADGIDIDYEGLGRENRESFTQFIQLLTQRFHAQNKKVSVTLEARINNDVPMDWNTLGQQADQVRVMAYDYHSRATGTPGSISPLGWVQEVVQYAVSQVDPRKVVVGLGDYGYDWTEPENQDSSWQGIGVSREQALALAKTYSRPITRQTGIDSRGYDLGSIPQFNYTDATGKRHEVWYEDADSLQAKTIISEQYHPASVMLWSAGLAQATSIIKKTQ